MARRPKRGMLAALIGLGAIAPPALGSAEETLEALEARAQEARSRLGTLESEEGRILETVEALDELLEVEEAALNAARRRVEETEAALEETEAEIGRTEEALAKARAELEPRLVARYRLGDQGYLPLLLSAGTVHELQNRRRMLARVVEADVAMIEEVRELRDRLASQRSELERGREQLAQLQSASEARLASLEATRAEREETLAEVRRDQAAQVRILAEIGEARQRLQERMERMAAEQRPGDEAADFELLRGALPMPAEGAIEVGFGTHADPESRTVKVHRGIDIRARRGAPVQAVANGEVVHAGRLRGYGNLVIVEHGGGYYTLKAHLDAMDVRAGDAVRTGDRVGTVGDSGSLRGALLYFEIRRGAEALDPERWLAQ